MKLLGTLGLAVSVALPSLTAAQAQSTAYVADAPAASAGDIKTEYSPYLHQAYPDQVFWGDTHLHTSYSTDAGMIGNYLGPDDAFRFARGETVTASLGQRARLIRPLDFLVVADHSENLGLADLIAESNPDLLRNPWGKQVHDLVKAGKSFEAYGLWGLEMGKGTDPLKDDALIRTVWNRIVDSAERFNEPGVFTALHGFEWTSSPATSNLHRVVVFRDDAEEVEDLVPFSNYDSSDPEKLWDWMDAYEGRTGGQVLAIPHNGNLSNGLMFDDVTLDGKPMTREYAERRALWVPCSNSTAPLPCRYRCFAARDEIAIYCA